MSAKRSRRVGGSWSHLKKWRYNVSNSQDSAPSSKTSAPQALQITSDTATFFPEG